ncbi:MAG: hypothetical protein PHT99_08750 [Methanoregula sp.]|nr:hypothetical protein [Methanoregula sp.]
MTFPIRQDGCFLNAFGSGDFDNGHLPTRPRVRPTPHAGTGRIHQE